MASPISRLPPTFSYAEARSAGLSKHRLYAMRAAGEIEAFSRGLYRRIEAAPVDLELLEIAARAAIATMCLESALARHGLSDEIPTAPDIALPRGTRAPTTQGPVTWHWFDRATFEIGRESLRLDATHTIGLYSAERCIIDAFRTRGLGRRELAYDALKRWLRRPAAQPSTLLSMAKSFPRALGPIRSALEILL